MPKPQTPGGRSGEVHVDEDGVWIWVGAPDHEWVSELGAAAGPSDRSARADDGD